MSFRYAPRHFKVEVQSYDDTPYEEIIPWSKVKNGGDSSDYKIKPRELVDFPNSET